MLQFGLVVGTNPNGAATLCVPRHHAGDCRRTTQGRLADLKTRPDQTRPDQTRPDQTRPDQTRPDQTRPDQNRTEQNRTEQNRTEQNRTEQNRTEQNRDVTLRCNRSLARSLLT
jgi:hypothetical protein